jgi:hypothetical protein
MCPICIARCCWRRSGTQARINEALALTRGFFAGTAVSVCAAGHAQTACGKSGQNGRECPPAIRPIVWFRYPITSTSASCR